MVALAQFGTILSDSDECFRGRFPKTHVFNGLRHACSIGLQGESAFLTAEVLQGWPSLRDAIQYSTLPGVMYLSEFAGKGEFGSGIEDAFLAAFFYVLARLAHSRSNGWDAAGKAEAYLGAIGQGYLTGALLRLPALGRRQVQDAGGMFARWPAAAPTRQDMISMWKKWVVGAIATARVVQAFLLQRRPGMVVVLPEPSIDFYHGIDVLVGYGDRVWGIQAEARGSAFSSLRVVSGPGFQDREGGALGFSAVAQKIAAFGDVQGLTMTPCIALVGMGGTADRTVLEDERLIGAVSRMFEYI